MNNEPPLISFCIPTYNRPDEFERLLHGLLPQVTKEIEIVIRDDSSNNLTYDIVNRLLFNTDISYKYFRGNKIGADLAQLFLLEKSEGKYIWWFGDDDEILPGAIQKLISIVKNDKDIDFIWINFCYGFDSKLAINLPESRYFKDKNEVLDILGKNIGLLSTMFIKREKGILFLQLGINNSIGFGFAVLVPVLGTLTQNGKLYFLKGPYIYNNPTSIEEIKKITNNNGKIINNGFDVYGIIFYNIIMLYKDEFSRKSIKNILNKNLYYLWRGMIVGWIGGWDTPKGKRFKMFRYYWNYSEFWKAIIPLCLPKIINKYAYLLYKLYIK